ncbi:hypothetical protein CDG76_13820 [Nostoc sp. 'Peltigera membranacea cyanobiont' 210A]|uniref:hypothetical protein n=1 Tax=Nostoc sp. 'Peltigera membranacea cyanobiont' 210A TaxID=2014529 RepID=UPI000B957E3C|nr:hypothetical protein [Nostoc sp. 'Peltigera membranacea cyanobiont' 210A]OYD94490.1 hypothetical protein CDG76_13820 [Nostoc sp. 'Peltigera membranacea cyanobiont' 210A]
MLASKDEVRSQIYEDWGENPQSEICFAVLDYLLRVPIKNLLHITYGSLKKVVGQNYTNDDLLKAIQYLCGERMNLLEMNFEIIENDENIFMLSKEEVKIAQETGQLIHPETGKLVNNFKQKVFVYFQPGSLVKSIAQ